jgi:chromosomal replication initiator protein
MNRSRYQIIKAVALHYEIRVSDIYGNERTLLIAKARQMYFYIARITTDYSYVKIAEEINKNHATALHGYNTIASMSLIYSDIKNDINEILQILAKSIICTDIDLLELCQSNNEVFFKQN